jgi:hypothetical protein
VSHQVHAFSSFTIERIEVIDDGDAPVIGKKRIHEMAPNKARPAGYERMARLTCSPAAGMISHLNPLIEMQCLP